MSAQLLQESQSFMCPKATRSRRAGWYLVDFANSILIINGGLYFPEWIVVDNKISATWFNATIVITSVLLIASGPMFGKLVDAKGRAIAYLRSTSLAMLIATLAIYVVSSMPVSTNVRGITGLIAFGMLLYAFQLASVFYNSLLPEIATPNDYAAVSGTGLALGWIGGLLGILLVYPFTSGWLTGAHGVTRSAAFLPCAVAYAIFSTIAFMLLGSSSRLYGEHDSSHTSHGSTVIALVSRIYRNAAMRYFLIGYFLFSDAVLTIQNNATLYLHQAMHFNDQGSAILFVVLLLTAAIGGRLSGIAIRRFGEKSTLLFVLGAWIIVLALISVTHDQLIFSILFACVGLNFGALWNSSRVTFLRLMPLDQRGEYFGVYAAFERFSSVIGPIAWSVPLLLRGESATTYRLSMLIMSFLIAIGTACIFAIRMPLKDRIVSVEWKK